LTITIRDLAANDEQAWRTLWQGYCDFYQTKISPVVTDATWRRLMDGDSPLFGLVACDGGADGVVTGLANCILHPVTWSAAPACYLEDLFVAPAARKRGAGRALINAVLERGQQMGWYRVYWMTKRNNRSARSLYDAIAGKTDWVRYQVTTSGTA
jgi:GNAT superfamily N-acetyltransferase